MANIAISDLRPAGYDLFSDTESFLINLSEEELCIQGGILTTLCLCQTPPSLLEHTVLIAKRLF
jgi:hypothetical protein